MATDAFRRLVSGESSGVSATALRGLFRLLSEGYRAGVWCRNRLFDWGIRSAFRPPAVCISVGNITAGGTGKTPVVAWLANWFQSRDARVAILSRGYKSLDSGANDEKLVLDRLCPGIPHLQNPNRVASAKTAIRDHQSRVLLLDDAFQHRRIARDLDVVLIDATNPWGYGYLLPRGLLRESKSGLKRADVIVITRSDQVEPSVLDRLKTEVHSFAGDIPLLTSRFAPSGWLTLDGQRLPLTEFAHRSVIGCCGIGNPESFRKTLTAVGCDVKQWHSFADHHHFEHSDFERLRQAAADHNAGVLAMTLKDLVKFPADAFPGLTAAALLIEWEILEGAPAFFERLNGLGDEVETDTNGN